MNPFFNKKVPPAHVSSAMAAIKMILISTLFMGFMGFMLATPSWAGEGHDHGETPTATASAGAPRVSSSSDLFELVGIVQGKEMVIYLDRFATNAPVTDAKIEVDLGSVKGLAEAQEDGTYRFNNPALAVPGSKPISFTVTAGADSDLLAGDLTVGDAAPNDKAPAKKRAWLRWVAYAVAAVVTLLVLFAAFKAVGRRKNLNQVTPLVIALCAGFAAVTTSFEIKAGEGHDHGEAPTAVAGNGPRRLPDGSVFLPKNSQRQLAVRTMVAELKSLPKTIELGGVVTIDPNAGGRVQPTIAGRLEAGPRGLPQLGQSVRKGEVLAFVRASANPIERGNQLAQTAELKARLQLAEKRATRLAQLEGTVVLNSTQN